METLSIIISMTYVTICSHCTTRIYIDPRQHNPEKIFSLDGGGP